MSVKQGEEAKVVSSFKIDPKLLEYAKELAWVLRVSYSSKVEELVKEWITKEADKLLANPKTKDVKAFIKKPRVTKKTTS